MGGLSRKNKEEGGRKDEKSRSGGSKEENVEIEALRRKKCRRRG